jgi:hypothetical protein
LTSPIVIANLVFGHESIQLPTAIPAGERRQLLADLNVQLPSRPEAAR